MTTNIFDVDKLTTELINEINLLEAEAKYFKNITIKYSHEHNGPDNPFHILFDRQLYTITSLEVASAKKQKKYLNLNLKSELNRWIKSHSFWIFQDPSRITIFSQWGI